MNNEEKNEIINEIDRLKKKKNAIIVAHNYQSPDIQDIADFTGDSLELARKTVEITQPVIIFCGVYFMAETAVILNPDKTVLLPDLNAGCPLANFADPKSILEWKKCYPDHALVAYVNTNADVKAVVDICCTSSNALKVINSIKNDKIIFLPDKNLGAYIRSKTDKKIVLWPGYCIVHEKADYQTIVKTKEKYPEAVILAHPECPQKILEITDEICSTGQMFKAVEKHSDVKQFIVVTEWGMIHALHKKFPDREFIEPLKRMQCANMKKITLKKVLNSLKNDVYRVSVKPDIAKKAKSSIIKMLNL